MPEGDMVELATRHLRLSPLDIPGDAPDLHAAYADPLVMMPWLNEEPAADVAEIAARLGQRLALDGAALWSVRRRHEDAVLGLVERVGATSPPGLSWMLRRDAWGKGIMSEAAPAVVEYLLGDGGADLVEAWADAINVASVRVAWRAGLTERARFARRGPDGEVRETLVLVRLRDAAPQAMYAADAVLPVRDVAATLDLLDRALGCHPGFRAGDPPYRAGVRLTPWSGSPGLQLLAAEQEAICPVTVYVHCGTPVGQLYSRVEAAGVSTDGPPQPMPWGRTEFWVRLPEGHRLCVSGPV